MYERIFYDFPLLLRNIRVNSPGLHFVKGIIKRLLTKPAVSDFLRKIAEANFIGQKEVIIKEINSTKAKRVLDLASGTGVLSGMFSVEEYVGADTSKFSVEYAKRKFRKNFLLADGMALGFNHDTFNTILVCGLFHHLSDSDSVAVLQEMQRISTIDCLVLIMEDVPTVSRYNIIGKMIHKFDQGNFIRIPEEYIALFDNFFVVQKDYYMRSGFCDYYVFVLGKN